MSHHRWQAPGRVDVVALLEQAETSLYSGNIDGARRLVERALAAARDPASRTDAVLLAAEIASAEGDLERAGQLFTGADLSGVREPELFARAGYLCLDFEDPEAAAELFSRAVELEPRFGDGFYGLGLARRASGDVPGATEAWLTALELDETAEDPAWRFTDDEFAALAETALAELPPRVVALLENVPILVDEAPSRDDVARGTDPRLLGLFSGVPLPGKSHVGEQIPALDAIHIYKRNLERSCRDRHELAAEIRITLLHETAHFFGLDDDDLAAIGLD